LGIAFALAWPLPAQAAADGDIRALREQLEQLKESYRQRIESLEQRLAAAEAKAAGAESAAVQAQTTAQQAVSGSPQRTASPGAFNPEIAVILNGTYTRLSQDPDRFRITGFVPSLGEVAPPPRSFSLGESELSLAASVDPYFRGQLTAAIAPEGGIDVEEAFLRTLGLGQGFVVKGGRFFSGIGYLNEQHAHAWDFTDAPLPYKAFFANQLDNEGVQLKWVAPTETFVEIGVEGGRGGAFPSTDRNKNGNTLGSIFAHVGGDVGTSHSWRAGLSHVRTSPRDRAFDDTDSSGVAVTDSFSGTSHTTLADFVWKWAPEGNPQYTSFKLQGEYMRRRESGVLAFDSGGASALGTRSGSFDSHQSGWYLQGIYQFMPNWRVGYRYDRLDFGTVAIGLIDNGVLSTADLPLLQGHDPTRNTVMVDWSPSEFSHLRFQFAQDKSRLGQTDNQIWLQYLMSLGSHGAHKF
jgi:hypothetical protein